MDRPGLLHLIVFLVVGILSVSCGSIFVRLAGAPPLAVAAYRVSWATLLLAPLVLAGPIRELAALTRREWGFLLLSGTALALHFALWIASLSYTSVASSVLFVNTTPLFLGLASRWLSAPPCKGSFWLGLGIAFPGCLLIFHGDWSHGNSPLKGDALALGGAAALAVYLLVGAHVRQKLSLLAYVWPVYASSAMVLLLACIALGTPLQGLSPETHLYVFLLALIPQCIGHTTYNWSLRWLAPALVALISLSEPVGATLLACMILHENLTVAKIVGGGVVLLGIYLAARGR